MITNKVCNLARTRNKYTAIHSENDYHFTVSLSIKGLRSLNRPKDAPKA